jgi:hypothetical protein
MTPSVGTVWYAPSRGLAVLHIARGPHRLRRTKQCINLLSGHADFHLVVSCRGGGGVWVRCAATTERSHKHYKHGVSHIQVGHNRAQKVSPTVQRCASPTAAREAGGAHKGYTNWREPPSGKRGRRLGAGASFGEWPSERPKCNGTRFICAPGRFPI